MREVAMTNIIKIAYSYSREEEKTKTIFSSQKFVPNFVAIAFCVNCFNASYQLQVFEIVLLRTNQNRIVNAFF